MRTYYMWLLLCLAASACAEQDAQYAASKTSGETPKQSASSTSTYSRVEIAYAHEKCSYLFSPIDFCDERHIAAYNQALKQPVNFANKYILLSVSEYERYHQRSIVVLDPATGVVYPLPIDAYSGYIGEKGNIHSDGKLSFSLDNNEICIEGTILVYRALEPGKFCFTFENGKFGGHSTQYMQQQ